MNSQEVARVSMYASLGAGLRLIKHAIAGPVQFVNFPYAVAALASLTGLGYSKSLIVGALAFIVSDLMLQVGPWTLTNILALAAALMLLAPFTRLNDRVSLGVALYFSLFMYDVLSSLLGYLWFLGGGGLYTALYLSLLGLFLPAGGGGLLLVGPTTELVTALTILTLLRPIRKLGVRYSVGGD